MRNADDAAVQWDSQNSHAIFYLSHGCDSLYFLSIQPSSIFFNSAAGSQVKQSKYSSQFIQLENQYRIISEKETHAIRDLAGAFKNGNPEQENQKVQQVQAW